MKENLVLRPSGQQISIEDELWQQLKQWWGVESAVFEITRLEAVARDRGVSPLTILKRALVFIGQNDLWV